jgi:fructokinase
VLVTCGAGGAWQVNGDGTEVRVANEGPPIRVVDTVGAGGGFAAVFIVGALRGWPVALTLSRAHAFAAAVCGIRGAIPAGRDFYAPFMEQWQIGQETQS